MERGYPRRVCVAASLLQSSDQSWGRGWARWEVAGVVVVRNVQQPPASSAPAAGISASVISSCCLI